MLRIPDDRDYPYMTSAVSAQVVEGGSFEMRTLICHIKMVKTRKICEHKRVYVMYIWSLMCKKNNYLASVKPES